MASEVMTSRLRSRSSSPLCKVINIPWLYYRPSRQKTAKIATSEVKRPRIEVTKEDTDPQVEANISAKFDLCGLSGLGGEDGHIHIYTYHTYTKSAYINKIGKGATGQYALVVLGWGF